MANLDGAQGDGVTNWRFKLHSHKYVDDTQSQVWIRSLRKWVKVEKSSRDSLSLPAFRG